MISAIEIEKNISNAIKTVPVRNLGKKQSGKVRDWYTKNGLRILIATDRISAFDRVLGLIPFRGAVLNKLSEFWFNNTRDIISNHMIGVVDPNIMLVSEVQALPVEIVVRGYITGVTTTSLWKQYSDGQRVIYGIKFPEGLKKNQKLKSPIVTPTTRATGVGGHDEPITKEEIIKQKLISPVIYKQIERTAIKLFERGTAIADKGGFVLADTKYEFGLDRKGRLMLIDEIHTPDSSRYWLKRTYVSQLKKGEEPENYDKEFMRLWFAKSGYTGKGKPPQIPNDIVVKISTRYMDVYEKLTGEKFEMNTDESQLERIMESLEKLV